MATRTIVTSQPDVACDVCARRLLRGEQPDVFVGAGRRRIVCELCAPRAAHAGWMREADGQSLTLPPMRPRRGRGLIERLPAAFRPRQVSGEPGETPGVPAAGAEEQLSEPYDLFAEAAPGIEAAPAHSRAQPFAAAAPDALIESADVAPEAAPPPDAEAAQRSETGPAFEPPSEYVQHAVTVFNASEFPRRVAGVTRSLGPPLVTVRSAEHLDSVVSIVVAWELCWYRYEVDISEPVVEAQVIAQGTELSELAREDRIGNAVAAESGLLSLAGV
ncbi:MAG TPA: hypothetical protein VK790_06050 [Solirubrobacteraceae bacterium]|jgi:hypothetical protein|nr:hypothetical protein [Solirubrobacteraceae bacterium]